MQQCRDKWTFAGLWGLFNNNGKKKKILQEAEAYSAFSWSRLKLAAFQGVTWGPGWQPDEFLSGGLGAEIGSIQFPISVSGRGFSRGVFPKCLACFRLPEGRTDWQCCCEWQVWAPFLNWPLCPLAVLCPVAGEPTGQERPCRACGHPTRAGEELLGGSRCYFQDKKGYFPVILQPDLPYLWEQCYSAPGEGKAITRCGYGTMMQVRRSWWTRLARCWSSTGLLSSLWHSRCISKAPGAPGRANLGAVGHQHAEPGQLQCWVPGNELARSPRAAQEAHP